jgi:membrane protease YdiL (CAAX protease family)
MSSFRFPYLSAIVWLFMIRLFYPVFLEQIYDFPLRNEINKKTGEWLTVALVLIGFFIVRKMNKSSYNELLESAKSKKTSLVFVIVCVALTVYYFAFSFWALDGKGFSYSFFFVIPTIIALTIVEVSITRKSKTIGSEKLNLIKDGKSSYSETQLAENDGRSIGQNKFN